MGRKKKYTWTYKHHYIYKITCLCGNLAGYYYIGKHSTTKKDAMDDGYYGGGVIIRNYYEKYPPEIGKTITKEILEYNGSVKENSNREKEIIGDLWKTDPMCLNKKKGGEGGNGRANKGKKHSREQVEQQADYMKEYWKTHCPPNVGKGYVVDAYDDNGDFFGRFGTTALAAFALGITTSVQVQSSLKNGYRCKCSDGKRMRFRRVDSMKSPYVLKIEPYLKQKRVFSKEWIEKLRAAKLGTTMPWEWVPVIATDRAGNETSYKSIVDAAEKVHPENIESGQKLIQAAAKKRRRSAYGFTWKYAI